MNRSDDISGVEMEHQHVVLESSVREIVGGGSIGMESCGCGAMRSVIQKPRGGIIRSEWVTDDTNEIHFESDNDNS